MRKIWFSLLIATLVSALSACEKDSPEPEQQEEESAVESGEVEVTAEGNEFDPPVSVEQMPEGAWYCDMGTVHYASMEHGDGACPICGMTLAQRPVAEPEPSPVEPPATEPAPTEAAPVEPPTTAPAPTEPPTTQPL